MSNLARIAWAALAIGLAAAAQAQAAPPAWGGANCAEAERLSEIVDVAFGRTPAATVFPGRGTGAPGYSVAVLHDDCGLFTYAVGLRRLEGTKAMLASTRQHIGSMTKPVTTALTLILADQGLLGPQGLETTVDTFFTGKQRKRLKKGLDRSNSLCPARILGLDRDALEFGSVRAKCPKFAKITVRQLLNGNHGLWDFLNEIDRDGNGLIDIADHLFSDLLDFLQIERIQLPSPVNDSLDVLIATGVLENKRAKRGGSRVRDFEVSFGNTGYQLLGVILETVSGMSYDALVKKHIVKPLGLTKMALVTEPPKNRGGKLATPYGIVSGAGDSVFPDGTELEEDLFGVYPLADINGHPAIDTYDFSPYVFTNGGGGAGGLSAAPKAYVQFFHALVRGGLLSPDAQAWLDGAYVDIEGAIFEHGFALFSAPSIVAGRIISKSGQVAGSNCVSFHSLERDGGDGTTVVVCRNSVDLFLPTPDSGDISTSADVGDIALDLLVAALP